jgi:hypothetical protein
MEALLVKVGLFCLVKTVILRLRNVSPYCDQKAVCKIFINE